MSAHGLAPSSACGLDTGQGRVLALEKATVFLLRTRHRCPIPHDRY